MATLKQERLVKALSGNVRSKAEALRKAGYSENMAMKPSVVLAGLGIAEKKAELLAEFEQAGITNDLKVKRIKEIITGSDANKAAEQIWKLLEFEYGKGMDKLADTINNTQVNIASSPESIEESVLLWIKNNPDKHSKVRELIGR